MLETLLQQLIEAINNNTKATLKACSVVHEAEAKMSDDATEEAEAPKAEEIKPKRTRAAKTEAALVPTKKPAAKPALTIETVKELSAELNEHGIITVKETRAKIQELGYNLMKEMSDDDLAELYNWLLEQQAAAANDEADANGDNDEDL